MSSIELKSIIFMKCDAKYLWAMKSITSIFDVLEGKNESRTEVTAWFSENVIVDNDTSR